MHVTIDDVSVEEGIGKAALFQALAELPRTFNPTPPDRVAMLTDSISLPELVSLRLTNFVLGGLPTDDPSLTFNFPTLRTLSLGVARIRLDEIDLTFLTT